MRASSPGSWKRTVAVLVADLICERREALGWAPGRLADQVGEPVSAVTVIESGRELPETRTLAPYAAALGIDFREFFACCDEAGSPPGVVS